jgi:serine/threonine protein kinase/tetratricopeptide (TPR) repeat protein
MESREIRTCKTCGAPLAVDAADVFCPCCMLRSALGSTVEFGGEGFVTSTPEDDSSVYRFEHYELVTGEDGKPIELGRGAMGVTYKAFDVDLRCPVTVKVISERFLNDESARLRFLREARAAASLRHPNVASVFHLGKTGENYFYAMEFVNGETLESLIRRSGRLEVKLALEIATEVAAGLAAVHKQKLVHRDIKVSNIMVSLEQEGAVTAKIIDLGLAKAVTESHSEAAISQPGTFAGTPEFASPEQFAGIGVDIRSDLYSLGVALWMMLTGKVPFRGAPAELMYQHQHAPLPLEQLKGVPQPVSVILEVLLEKDPAGRFQSPHELLKVIPTVTDAIDRGRTINKQSLRTLSDERLSKNVTKNLARVRVAMPASKVRFIISPAFVLLLAGGLILAVFVGFNRPVSDSRSASLSRLKPPEKSIAVLPFESLSDNKNDTYFADGVQDEILASLAKVSELKVVSRTSVMTYRPSGTLDLRSVADALKVANVVEGTVRRDGNRVRVTTELIDARTDATLWSGIYDRDLTDVFVIQSEIAKTVVSKLSARLSLQEKKEIEERPTNDLDAFDLYLQAKELLANSSFLKSRESYESCLGAIRLLEETTRKDPRFALAFCLMAKAHDWLYANQLDNTPERRALGDAAVEEALGLRPDLPEVHLAAAHHRYFCYRDYEGARVHIVVAQRALPNSPEVFALVAYLDRRQGRWEESTISLEKAVALDPRNPEILGQLALTYQYLRRYRDYEQTCSRLIELQPEEPLLKILIASAECAARANLTSLRAALGTFPSSMKDDINVASFRFNAALLARDWTSAKETLSKSVNAEFYFFDSVETVPRGCLEIWLAQVQGDRPTMEARFAVAREQLNRKVEVRPRHALLLSALGVIDAALGRKQEAIQEARRAVEMLPISEDAMDGPLLVSNLAIVYARTNEPDLAFQELAISIKTPGGVNYGELKLDPAWDPLRDDPRFDKLLTQLAPHE